MQTAALACHTFNTRKRVTLQDFAAPPAALPAACGMTASAVFILDVKGKVIKFVQDKERFAR